MAGQRESTGFHQSFTNSLSVVGSRANFQVIYVMQSSSPCTKTREKSQIAPTIGGLVPTIAENHLPETQCGFRNKGGTTDVAFVLWQLQEKCWEKNKGLYVAFADLTKAFDSVNRKGLWMIMERLGLIPPQVHQHCYPTAQRPAAQPS